MPINQNNFIANVTRVNLTNYGFEESGRNTGNPNQFRIHLNSIKSLNLLDETTDTNIIEDGNRRITNDILEKKGNIENLKTEIQRIEKIDIPQKVKEIEDKNKEIELELTKHHTPNYFLLAITILFFTGLTIFVFMLYTGIIYDVFKGNTKFNFPDLKKLAEIKSKYPLYFLSPSIIGVLALSIHIIFEKDDWEAKRKYLFSGIIVIITFLVDVFFGYKINENLNLKMIKNHIPGDPVYIEKSLFENGNFYLILILGFISYIFWSIILHNLLTQLNKNGMREKSVKNLKKMIKQIEVDIANLRRRLIEGIPNDVNRLNTAIDQLNKDFVDKRHLKDTLNGLYNNFALGWNNFLNQTNHEEKKTECNTILNEFLIP
jgi:hypothetical protein